MVMRSRETRVDLPLLREPASKNEYSQHCILLVESQTAVIASPHESFSRPRRGASQQRTENEALFSLDVLRALDRVEDRAPQVAVAGKDDAIAACRAWRWRESRRARWPGAGGQRCERGHARQV